MRRRVSACAVLGFATGCLEPGDPVLTVRDTDPPEVESTEPAANGTLARSGSLRITFSELMDERSLRPGIAVFAGPEEIALRITMPPLSDVDANVERGDIPYTVTASAESGAFAPNTSHTLVLRTVLTDYEGNPLVDEVRVSFRTSP